MTGGIIINISWDTSGQQVMEIALPTGLKEIALTPASTRKLRGKACSMQKDSKDSQGQKDLGSLYFSCLLSWVLTSPTGQLQDG